MTLLIFDCDGTLVDSELLYAEIETGYIKEKFGMQLDVVEHSRRFCGTSLDQMYEWIEQETKSFVSDDFKTELKQRKIAAFKTRLKRIPYVAEVLQTLSHIPKCVASNTELKTLTHSLQTTGLFRWFAPNIYSAQMVARSKPAPDLFLYAAQQMNVVPHDCIVIEDSQHGIDAALAAQMRVFGFAGGSHHNTAHPNKLSKAELIFNDMRELPNLIKF